MRPLDRDLMHSAATRDVARGAMALIDANQDQPPHVQLLSQAANFLLLSEYYGVPAQDVFAAANNLMNYAEGRRPEFAAVAQYMEQELG